MHILESTSRNYLPFVCSSLRTVVKIRVADPYSFDPDPDMDPSF
jgi:hypothetical protein